MVSNHAYNDWVNRYRTNKAITEQTNFVSLNDMYIIQYTYMYLCLVRYVHYTICICIFGKICTSTGRQRKEIK